MARGWNLVGRHEQLAVITDALTALTASGVLIHGPAGVGKSRLAEEALSAAQRQGWRTGRATASLNGSAGGDDGAADSVVVNATSGDDVVTVEGAGQNAQISGLRTLVSVSGAVTGLDRVTVNALAGADVVDASGMSGTSALLTVDGGDGDDVLLGGQGDDILLGGAGDDVLVGGPGSDSIDGGPGDNVVMDAFGVDGVAAAAAAGPDWMPTHTRTVDGTTVLDLGERQVTLPRADLTDLAPDARSS